MRSVSDAVALTRGLLAVAERRGRHRVRVRSGRRAAELWVEDGLLRRLLGVDGEPLGDTLLRHGVLDVGRHAAALPERDGREPVGEWLVRVGAAEPAAVCHALELQVMGRVAQLLRWPSPRFESCSGVEPFAEETLPQVALSVAVWLSLLAWVRDEDEAAAPSRTAQTTPSAFGRRLLRQLDLHGLETAGIEAALAGRPEARSERRALELMGATSGAGVAHAESHGLLLRKHRELRRAVPAHVLLEVAPTASALEAKRAYRRLVHQLHPDRFGVDNPPITQRATEVVRGLSQAVRVFTTVASSAGCAVR